MVATVRWYLPGNVKLEDKALSSNPLKSIGLLSFVCGAAINTISKFSVSFEQSFELVIFDAKSQLKLEYSNSYFSSSVFFIDCTLKDRKYTKVGSC